MAMPPPFLEAAATTIYGDLSPNETPKSTADSIGYAREQRIFCRLPLALASWNVHSWNSLTQIRNMRCSTLTTVRGNWEPTEEDEEEEEEGRRLKYGVRSDHAASQN